MFDVGFTELALICVVALLVVGPERLPKVARTAGLWLGKARHLLSSVKADIDLQIKTEELQQTLRRQADIPDDIFEEIDLDPVKPKSSQPSVQKIPSHE